ncbi:hypothetical protein H696_04655 [Fonticula alba]|uniref:S1 motif domain-containing protein n=1 Tax=Fonticula alba TaxID=691883 RepID=A0A058Z5L8_FONAL|nr:hypothetical protein H696_04655 [Fonticula alba]KCV69238.1 hypothetical protein H696_04655 [Fonticula alba]|eukprot:XP_009496809.1 hypothetical protein H696_04655 [Fonticula alba]
MSKKSPPTKSLVASASASSAVEQDFPRGGSTGLAPVEYRDARRQAQADAEKELLTKLGKRSAQDDELTAAPKSKRLKKKDQAAAAPTNVVIPPIVSLRFKSLRTGMSLLGAIKEIGELELAISLPNGLTGYVHIAEISPYVTAQVEHVAAQEGDDISLPNLAEIFRVGDFVRCVITELGRTETNRNRIDLSINPQKVNLGITADDLVSNMMLSCSVKSIEDHGYQLDIGQQDVRGFLRNSDAKDFIEKRGRPLALGEVLIANVHSINGGVARVTLNPSVLSTAVTKVSQVSTWDSLKPGVRVSAFVDHVIPSGLRTTVLGSFKGTIDIFNLGISNLFSAPIESLFSPGTRIEARVIFVNVVDQVIGLSLLEHVLALKPCAFTAPASQLRMGAFFEQATVTGADEHSGVALSLGDGMHGFAHATRLVNDTEKIKNFDRSFGIGTRHRCRVLSVDYFSSLLQVTLQPSVLAIPYISYADLSAKKKIQGQVLSHQDAGFLVQLCDGIVGYCSYNHASDVPLSSYAKKFPEKSKARFLVMSCDPARKRLVLNARRSMVQMKGGKYFTDINAIKVGDVSVGLVSHVAEYGLFVRFLNNVSGMAHISQLSQSHVSDVSQMFKRFQPVRARVIAIDNERGRLSLSLIMDDNVSADGKDMASLVAAAKDNPASIIGKTLTCTVKSVDTGSALVSLGPSTNARVSVVDVVDGFPTRPLAALSAGQRTKCRIIRFDPERNFIDVTLRKSLLSQETLSLSVPEDTGSAQAPLQLVVASQLQAGQIVGGYVSAINQGGIFVQLTSEMFGRIKISEISDLFIKDWQSTVSVGQPVSVYVISVDHANLRAELSLRESRLNPSVSTVTVGQRLRGSINRIVDFGLFVSVSPTLRGLCHINQVPQYAVGTKMTPEQLHANYQIGQLVQVMVISYDAATRKIGFSMLPEHFENISDTQVEDFGVQALAESIKQHHTDDRARPQQGVSAAAALLAALSASDDNLSTTDEEGTSDSDMVESDSDEDMVDAHSGPASDSDDDEDMDLESDEDDDDDDDETGNTGTLVSAGQFDWSGSLAPVVQSDSDAADSGLESAEDDTDEEDGEDGASEASSRQKAKRAKQRAKREREQEILARERELAAEVSGTGATPRTADDFDRLLLSSPNSSFLWIKFMAFHLSTAQIDQARAVAERALSTIDFRQEQEKYNIWIALLNLESRFGTEQSFAATAAKAAQFADAKKILLQVACIHEQAGRLQQALLAFQCFVKKYKQSSKAWLNYGQFLLRLALTGERIPEMEEGLDAPRVLQRSLLSLPRHKHIKTIAKFAQAEFRLGSPERGRTLFEALLSSHPKRLDLWSVYVDMEVRAAHNPAAHYIGSEEAGTAERVRALLARLASLTWPARSMRFILKKWMTYEARNNPGDEAALDRVRTLAREYVSSLGN